MRQFNCKVVVEGSLESKESYLDNDDFSVENSLLITHDKQTLKWRKTSISLKNPIKIIDGHEKLSGDEKKFLKIYSNNPIKYITLIHVYFV